MQEDEFKQWTECGPNEPREEFEPRLANAIQWIFYLTFRKDEELYIVDVRFEKPAGASGSDEEVGEVVVKASSIVPLDRGWFVMKTREPLRNFSEAFERGEMHEAVRETRDTLVAHLAREREAQGEG